ncbi:MAG: 23S rRNA (guanosine(2251)-2'-O)-methyltransferase RlmB [Flavobacteriales bacterium]|nr:23S rRNA (guanosine(2251)-2'-O)-methyltransferase RlmB [Flavobacteriales bacterium]
MEKFTRNKKKDDQDIVWGIRPVMEAIEAGKTVDRVLIRKQLRGALVNELIALIKDKGIHRQYVPESRLNFLTRKNHQGVVAFMSPIEYHDISEIVDRAFQEGRTPRIVALDGITDVRNLGAIARTAECAGMDAVLIPAKGSAQINADTIKASAGAMMRIPVCKASHFIKELEQLKSSGLSIVSCTEKAESNLYASNLSGPICIVMGSEDMGIQPSVLEMSNERVRIPMSGQTASLNVSVSAGVVIYEMVRQITESVG